MLLPTCITRIVVCEIFTMLLGLFELVYDIIVLGILLYNIVYLYHINLTQF